MRELGDRGAQLGETALDRRARREFERVWRGVVVLGVDMDRDVGDVVDVAFQPLLGQRADPVPLGNAQPRIDQQVYIGDHPAAVGARAQRVKPAHIGNRAQGLADVRDALGRQAGVNQLAHCLSAQVPSDAGDHRRHQQRRHGIERGQSGARADQADQHDDRGNRIAAMVPGVGAQQVGIDPAGIDHRVLKQPFLAEQRTRGGEQCQPTGHELFPRRHEPRDGVPADADRHRQQQSAENQRRHGFVAFVAIRMIGIRRGGGVPPGEPHQHIARQIGQ